MSKQVLIVEDNVTHLRVLQAMVEKIGYKCKCFQDPVRALKFLNKPENEDTILCVLVDILMPEMNGLEFVSNVKTTRRNIPCIMVTAESQIDTIIEAIKSGAIDFITKPVDEARLKVSIDNAVKFNTLNDEVSRLQRYEESDISINDLLCNSSAMNTVVKQAAKACKSDIPVFIEGDTGVGKKLLARAIHSESRRGTGKFITINCNELDNTNSSFAHVFGSEDGEYPVSNQKITGKIREADGGTLFIENINNMPFTIQSKLLKVLMTNEVQPIGGSKKYQFDTRIMCSSTVPLEDKVSKDEFNSDLYYKLHVFPVYIPPLSERKKDIKVLLNHYLSLYTVMENKDISSIEAKTLKKLIDFPWPGNVRQLKNAVFRAVVLCESKELNLKHFDTLQLKGRIKAKHQINGVSSDDLCLFNKQGKMRQLKEIESDIIRTAISHHNGHMSKVARDLGIGRSTLYRKLDSTYLE